MLPDRVSNPGPLSYESGALPIKLNVYFLAVTNIKRCLINAITSYVGKLYHLMHEL